MSRRVLASIGALPLIAVVWLEPVVVAGQVPTAAATTTAQATGAPPRTPWGDPDLQGIWINEDIDTPMERPKEFGDRQFLTDQEVAAKERAQRERVREEEAKRIAELGGPRSLEEARGAPAHEKGIRGEEYNRVWVDTGPRKPGRVWRRTSLIVDPPDGRNPPLTLEALKRLDAREEGRRGRGEADGPEDRNLGERCLRGAMSVLGATKLILQVPGYVMIFQESGHHTRIIPLDGR